VCTVSIVSHAGGVRVACNRDEAWTRPPAEPPARRPAGAGWAEWPTDPAGGGTWIGANDRGMVAVLLNRGARVALEATKSRGVIVPAALAADDIVGAVTRAIDASRDVLRPFTLVIVHGRSLAVVDRRDARVSTVRRDIGGPVMFTSSSLGDDLVEPPRRALFKATVADTRCPVRAQRAFHDHHWPSRPEISVRMWRPGASTVSRTVIDAVPRSYVLTYTPLEP
jgi:hypothetical protein